VNGNESTNYIDYVYTKIELNDWNEHIHLREYHQITDVLNMRPTIKIATQKKENKSDHQKIKWGHHMYEGNNV